MAGKSERSIQLSLEGKHKADKALLLIGSKAELAAQLRMSRTTINNFFKGEKVDRLKFLKICKALKLNSQEVAELPKVIEAEPKQETSTDSGPFSESVDQPRADTSQSSKESVSLLSLSKFCAYTFPLLRWMHQPVPAKYVEWYFRKIQEFFAFEGKRIPQKQGRLLNLSTEFFFRCVYSLPSEDFHTDLKEIDGAGELRMAYKGYMQISEGFGYKGLWKGFEIQKNPYSFYALSLYAVLSDFRDGLEQVVSSDSINCELTEGEQDILNFMICIIDFIFDEHSARRNAKNLDLPEGIVLQLQNVLSHAFKDYLGVKLPERRDSDEISSFSLYVGMLERCWKDEFGEDIDDE